VNHENIIFTNDDVMNYVIRALQWKLPRAPYPLIRPYMWSLAQPGWFRGERSPKYI